jgi:hypothetical protein
MDKTVVSPSLISSPDTVILFFLLPLSAVYLLIILVKALLNPNKCVPPSFWGMLLVKGKTSSEYPAFHSKEHSTITLSLVEVT